MSDIGECPSNYGLDCCGSRQNAQDGPKVTLVELEEQPDQASSSSFFSACMGAKTSACTSTIVETIDVHGQPRRIPAPRPVALERAMQTVLEHQDCWDEWLNILDPAALRAVRTGGEEAKPLNARKPFPLSESPASEVPSAPSGPAYAEGPAASVGSGDEYSQSDQTVIIFDWDDTLFPSHWLQQSDGFFKPLSETDAQSFLRLAEGLAAILNLAATFGKVVIVTNSSEPWVLISVRTFMPFLEPLINQFPVIYARAVYENAPGSDSSPSISGGALGAYKARLAVQADALAPQRWKEYVFREFIGNFYSGRSWKNVVSIGDSIYERDAIKHVVSSEQQARSSSTNGNTVERGMHCRLKTAKLIENPHIDDLIEEIRSLHNALGLLVQYDGHLEVTLDQDDLKHGLSLAKKILESQFE